MSDIAPAEWVERPVTHRNSAGRWFKNIENIHRVPCPRAMRKVHQAADRTRRSSRTACYRKHGILLPTEWSGTDWKVDAPGEGQGVQEKDASAAVENAGLLVSLHDGASPEKYN